jgi:hypothetical protein
MKSSVSRRAALVLLAALPAFPASAAPPIDGTWRLDERASTNVPEAAKGVELKIVLKGRELITQRFFEGKSLGEPVSVLLDGNPVEKEIGKGQRGTIEARWKDGGKMLEQIVRMKPPGALPVVQTTLTTFSEDGQVMTRQQTRVQGGEKTERKLVYLRKS